MKKHIALGSIRRLLMIALAVCLIAETSIYAKWSFGVMSDNHLAVGKEMTINQIDAQFIEKKVKFVIQVGDQTNAAVSPAVGGAVAQQLYNAGIGFFPVRANHEAWPQTLTGTNISIFKEQFPQTQGLSNNFGAFNFSSPVAVSEELNGLSYSFDYSVDGASARFVLIDDWGTPTVYDPSIGATSPYGYTVFQQQSWISTRLDKSTRCTEHAFVFSHHNLIGENHKDCLFKLANENTDGCQDLFFSSLGLNDVKFYISGHEHVYNRSVITSPDGNNHVWDLICAPAGTTPRNPVVVDPANTMFFGQKNRQMQVAQESNIVGFSIYTIDGPRVTVDYYSAPYAAPGAVFNFVKKETFGYSLNGKEFKVLPGGSFSGIDDNFEGTTARILNGTNDCAATDLEGRALTKVVNTGWSGGAVDNMFRSKTLTLWGMADFGTPDETDVYTLSLSYDPATKGACALMSQNAAGEWTHAVDLNKSGVKKFVAGAFKQSYGLLPGTYGIDHATKTVWAVVSHVGTFAVRASVDGDQDGDGDVDNDDVGIVVSYRNQSASVYPSADLDNDGKITVLDARKMVLLKTVN